MYSALKRDGKPLYAYAREGITLERAPRSVTIHALTLVSQEGNQAVFDVRCSKGTYVRTLAEDIGEKLGCGAHLVALRRTGIADITEERMTTLGDFEALAEVARLAALQPVDALLQALPIVRLNPADSAHLLQGRAVRALPDANPGTLLRAYGANGRLLGTVRGADDGKLHPVRLVKFAPSA